MKMKPETKAAFDQLDCVKWFSNVGTGGSDRVVYVNSWDEAIALAGSVKWENIQLEASNFLCRDIAAAAPKRFNDWNKIAHMVKEFTFTWVKRKMAEVELGIALPKVFEDVIQWDMAGLGIELEYSDVVPRGFYVGLAHFYIVGHFPCGWEGEWPSGKLVIW